MGRRGRLKKAEIGGCESGRSSDDVDRGSLVSNLTRTFHGITVQSNKPGGRLLVNDIKKIRAAAGPMTMTAGAGWLRYSVTRFFGHLNRVFQVL